MKIFLNTLIVIYTCVFMLGPVYSSPSPSQKFKKIQNDLNRKRNPDQPLCQWANQWANNTVSEGGLCTTAGLSEGCKVRQVGNAARCNYLTDAIQGYLNHTRVAGPQEICQWAQQWANNTVSEPGLCTLSGHNEGCLVKQVGAVAGCGRQ